MTLASLKLSWLASCVIHRDLADELISSEERYVEDLEAVLKVSLSLSGMPVCLKVVLKSFSWA